MKRIQEVPGRLPSHHLGPADPSRAGGFTVCGVLSWLSRNRPVDRKRLQSGLSALRHRGPDASARSSSTWRANSLVSCRSDLLMRGFRSSIPLPRSDQPFRHGDHVICYNGEIYNYRELAARFACRLATSDTQVLLSVLGSAGLGGLAWARGMWAFTWLDIRGRRLIAARDRYGKKPLFYVCSRSDIVLASEIDAIRTVLDTSFALRDESLATFLAEGWLFPRSDGRTHLHGVREVRPGHALIVSLDSWTLDEVPIDGLWSEASPEGLSPSAWPRPLRIDSFPIVRSASCCRAELTRRLSCRFWRHRANSSV